MAAERPRTWVLVAALAASVAVVHLVMGWHSEGPVVFDDEGGYLRIARHLAGEGPTAGVRYFPGYSLLIVPVHWALGSTGAIFLGVKVLNALLGAATVVLTYLTSGYLLPRDDRGKRLAATALVSLYPTYLLFSNQAFSENALVPLSMALAYLVVRLVPERPARAAAAGLGGLAAYGVVVHPRGIAAVGALTIVVAMCWRPWPWNLRRLLAFAVGVALVGLFGLVLLQWERTGAPAGSGTYGLDRIIDDRVSLEGVRTVLVGAAGQVLYLTVATGGLVVLAGFEVARAVRRAWREGDRSPATVVVVYAGLASVLVFVTSVLFISPRPDTARPDAALYGRYNEGFLAPLLLVGAGALVAGGYRLWDRERWWRGALPWLVGAVVVTTASVELWQGETLLSTPADNPFNILALYPVVVFLGGVEPVPIGIVGLAVTGGFLAVSSRAPVFGTALALSAFLGIAGWMAFVQLPDAHYDVRSQERVVAETANVIDDRFGIDCLGLDRFESPIYHFQLYRWYVDGATPVEFSSDHAPPESPCGPLVVTSRDDLDESYPGARLVAREGRGVDAYLWVLPGDLQERLESENMLS